MEIRGFFYGVFLSIGNLKGVLLYQLLWRTLTGVLFVGNVCEAGVFPVLIMPFTLSVLLYQLRSAEPDKREASAFRLSAF